MACLEVGVNEGIRQGDKRQRKAHTAKQLAEYLRQAHVNSESEWSVAVKHAIISMKPIKQGSSSDVLLELRSKVKALAAGSSQLRGKGRRRIHERGRTTNALATAWPRPAQG